MESAPALARSIVRSFRGKDAVANPDHPYLLLAPDVLAVDDRGLVAVFIEHSRERTQSRRFEARLLLGALALPTHTKFIAVPRYNDLPEHAVDAISDDGASQVAQDMMTVTRRRDPTPPDVRAGVAERARQATSTGAVGDLPSDVYEDALRRRRYVDFDDGRLVTDITDLSAARAVSRLKELMTLSLPREYALDNGAAYLRNMGDLPIHEVYGGDTLLSSKAFDPYKPLRAAAFAGWHVSGVPTESEYWAATVDFSERLEDE